MSQISMNPKVSEFIGKQKRWPDEIALIRQILLDYGLVEAFKWRNPCYIHNHKNIALIGSFKDFCCLAFFKGALLKDSEGILKQQGENTQSARIVPFTNVSEIIRLRPILKAYVFEAIEVEKSGLKIDYKKAEEMERPEELQLKFDRDPDFESAFQNLTSGRQKGYLLYFSGAKQAKTRESRIEKYRARILDGKGMHDCVCGHSQKMPSCDGSHKYI